MFDIRPGQPLENPDLKGDEKAASADALAIEMLTEIRDRKDWIEDFRARLEGAPLGNPFEVDDNHAFNGLEQLRDMSRNNLAKMITNATVDRLGILGFRSEADSDEAGDMIVKQAFEKDGMGHRAAEAMTLACGYRKSYLYVHPTTKKQRVVPPTNGCVISDIDGEPVAAVVVHRELYRDLDVAEFFFREVDEDTGEAKGPVHMRVATKDAPKRSKNHANRGSRQNELTVTEYDIEMPLSVRMTTGWTWWKQRTMEVDEIPVTPMTNKEGKNEFEDNVEVLDRINHMIFQRVIIVTMQAFRQRAVKGNLPEYDKAGNPIDYQEMFEPGPSSLWALPEGAEIWESTPPEITGILEAVKADVRDLASATYTPSTYLSDSGSNSAEGAQLQRENYLSKVEDRKRRFGAKWKRHISILMKVLGRPERSNMEHLEIIWEPSAVNTLTDQAAAFASLKSSGLAATTAMRIALNLTPNEIQRAQSELMEEALIGSITESLNGGTPIQRSAGSGLTAEAQAASNTNRSTSNPSEDNRNRS